MNGQATHIVPYDFSGEKGYSLFWDIYMDVELLQAILPKVNDEFNVLKNEYDQIRDDRSLAIVGAMLVENKLDNLLETFIPRFDNLAENKDFTFSFKVSLAMALKIIPSKILNAIDPIRKIRNGFAHNLKLKTFEGYIESQKDKQIKDFSMLENKLATFGELVVCRPRDDYKMLINTLVYALMFYVEQSAVYSQKCREQEFVDILFNNAQTMSEQHKALGGGIVKIAGLKKPDKDK